MKKALLGLLLAVTGCAANAEPPKTAASPTPTTAKADEKHEAHAEPRTAPADAKPDPVEHALDAVAEVHGAPGPWAVAGYRMSERALAVLALPRGSFDLQVVHWTPKQVKYSCIADGAAASSGASLGKLNLSLVETTPENVLTVYRNKKTGKSIAYRPTASFAKRYADTPRDQARALGREVMQLPEDQVFEEVAVK